MSKSEEVKDIYAYFKELGFQDQYRSGGGVGLTDLNGLGVFIEEDKKNVRLTAVDGIIQSSIDFSYPNGHIPMFIEKMKRHRSQDEIDNDSYMGRSPG